MIAYHTPVAAWWISVRSKYLLLNLVCIKRGTGLSVDRKLMLYLNITIFFPLPAYLVCRFKKKKIPQVQWVLDLKCNQWVAVNLKTCWYQLKDLFHFSPLLLPQYTVSLSIELVKWINTVMYLLSWSWQSLDWLCYLTNQLVCGFYNKSYCLTVQAKKKKKMKPNVLHVILGNLNCAMCNLNMKKNY